MDQASVFAHPEPSVFNYVLSFLLVGVAWGFTTPFIRRAAADFNARQEKQAGGVASSQGKTSRTAKTAQPGVDVEEEEELLAGDKQNKEGDGVEQQRHDNDAKREAKGSSLRRRKNVSDEDQNDNADQEDEEREEDDPLTPAWKRQSGSAATSSSSWLRAKTVALFWTVTNLLRTPAYSIPLVINLTGSVWFFLLVGKHELSLTVPLANSSAFLFTVLGEWYVERKVIAKETWLGMALVLGGIALCVHSKNQTV